MSSVFSYIDKYNISFLEKNFTEVDNLIFSKFSYIKFDGLLSFDEKISISDLYKKYVSYEYFPFDKDTMKLFNKLATSNRYSSLIVGNYLSTLSDSEEKQFGAITIYLPNNIIYVSFRGTDNTLIGIKEDFNMTYMSYVPSQIDSVKYLEKVSALNDYKIIVGGHSKGGNMAMYSASFCNQSCRDRIIGIYNNDGPGFFDEVLDSKGYQEILDKVYTFVPQTSIIGMLLNHREKYTVVKSRKSLIMQHDLLSWEIDDDKFVKFSSVNKKSKYIDEVMSELLKISKEEKKQFFEIIYQMLTSTGASTINELSNQKVKNAKEILNSYKKLDDDDKQVFIKIWKEIIKMAKSNIVHYLPKIKKDKTPNS